jgi:hypothetical protein
MTKINTNTRWQAPSTEEILTRLDKQSIPFEGGEISALEAGIRLLYRRSLEGDVAASIDLQKMRDRCRVEEPMTHGYLVVPEAPPLDVYEKLVYEQQAQYRERDYGKEEL